jgi:hypothetical protein
MRGMKCAGCGLESDNEKFFRTERQTFTSKTRSLCPACMLDKDDTVLKTTFWTLSGMGLAGVLLIFAFPGVDAGIWLLNMGWLLVAFLVSTVLHEIGHAAAGALSGHRIFYAEIGKGATVLEFKCFGVRWRFRALFFGGLVQALPRRRNAYRLLRTDWRRLGPPIKPWSPSWPMTQTSFPFCSTISPIGCVVRPA